MALDAIRELLNDDPALMESVEGKCVQWEGRIFKVETLDVRVPDGSLGYREVVRHHGGAGVCALRDGRLCLVRQWRVALGRMTLEIPAGKTDPNEDASVCAARELEEETGLAARDLEFLARSAGSVGFTNEATTIYLARGLEQSPSHPDEGEFVDVVWLPLDDVIEAICAGVIQDAKTIVSALSVRARGIA